MNQILVVGNKNKNSSNSSVDLKKIIIFFSIAIIVFGAILVIMGAVGLNKNNKNDNDNLTPGAIVDTTPTPDSTDDDELPTIELSISGENINIIARDETALDYVEYSWNEEEPQRVEADSESKNTIQISIELMQGSNTLNILAVDKAGNEQKKSQDFKGKIRPTVNLSKNDATSELIIEAECLDGISKLEFTLNGSWTRIPFEDNSNYSKEDWASINVIVEFSEDGKVIKAKYTFPMVEGENILNVYAYSLEGLVGMRDGKATKVAE